MIEKALLDFALEFLVTQGAIFFGSFDLLLFVEIIVRELLARLIVLQVKDYFAVLYNQKRNVTKRYFEYEDK